MIKNVYPVDEYVYELRFKNYSKFYQHVDDAFNEKLNSTEDPKIIRHPLNFTSPIVQIAERNSLIVDGHMDNFDYLIDEIAYDIEPKKSKKIQKIQNVMSTVAGIATVVGVIIALICVGIGVTH